MPKGVYHHGPLSKEHKEKLNAGWIGKHHSAETKKAISTTHLGRVSPLRGRHLSQATKDKIRAKHIGKTLSAEHRVLLSKSHAGKVLTQEHKNNIRATAKAHGFGKWMKGRKSPEDVKRKVRIARVKSIALNYGACWPSYNPRACEFFKSFDEQNQTKGQYAMYGGGEFYIKELGYYPDYFNDELKLIIEYDEPRHYDDQGNLQEKDVIRQSQIQSLYPDFEFRRIRGE